MSLTDAVVRRMVLPLKLRRQFRCDKIKTDKIRTRNFIHLSRGN